MLQQNSQKIPVIEKFCTFPVCVCVCVCVCDQFQWTRHLAVTMDDSWHILNVHYDGQIPVLKTTKG